jgi:hypothetical protein
MRRTDFKNPFRPGAGHMPPYLAGRQTEIKEFQRLLEQTVILENLVLTGLRGVGKTVLLETFKPLAIQEGWLWVGTDLSESTSISEERIAIRLMADLSVVTSSVVVDSRQIGGIGFQPTKKKVDRRLDFDTMAALFNQTPGLVSDKLKAVLELVWSCLRSLNVRGIVFAYDEAQNLSDHSARNEYPLSLMLDVFQSIQKKDIPFMLALTGLPTLFPKLVEARTFAERMFHVVVLDRLSAKDSRDAIKKPIQGAKCPVNLSEVWVKAIVDFSGGYPYFIQFMGREVYDVAIQRFDSSAPLVIAINDITRKLDTDFFAGRWARATDRQRELLSVVARLDNCDSEFTVQDVAEKSKEVLERPFSPSHISQMFATLMDAGLVYKNRHGKYCFAVPLLGRFIARQQP